MGERRFFKGLWRRFLLTLAVFGLLAALAVVRDGRIFGYDTGTGGELSQADSEATLGSGEGSGGDGQVIVSSSEAGADIMGYAGPVPVTLYVTDGRIDSVTAEPNHETPGFFNRVIETGILDTWKGKTLEEAAEMHVDAVSGATFSSKALIGNVQAAARHELSMRPAKTGMEAGEMVKWIIALVVAVSAAILPLFVHNKAYRIAQQLLNAGVLGFWAGTFVDYAVMIKVFGNWVQFGLAAAVTLVLLIVALLYPLFGRHGHYCTWACPLGSLQDLAGSIWKKKLHIPAGVVKGLNRLRLALWVVLMALLFIGIGAEWIDYELFSGFVVESASWAVMGTGIAFVLLSVFVPRPFCRFVCPTGTLLKDILP